MISLSLLSYLERGYGARIRRARQVNDKDLSSTRSGPGQVAWVGVKALSPDAAAALHVVTMPAK